MPIRSITIPDPVKLIDPVNKKEIPGDEVDKETGKPKPAPAITMKDFVGKLLFNPMWAENYKNIKAAKAIDKAFDKVEGEVQLAEDDWKKLKELVENPKQGGYGYHAAVMPQLLPFLDAIMEAKEVT